MKIFKILTAVSLLLSCLPLTAQTPRAKGFLFNAEAYKKSVRAKDLDVRGSGIRPLPMRLSLRPFCPVPQDQGQEPSCSVWAIAYGALTIQQAIVRKVKGTNDVNKIACSKSFVFNQLCEGDPDRLLSVETIIGFMKQHGTCLAATFRNDVPPSSQPDSLAREEARSRRLLAVSEVYDPDSSIRLTKHIQRFKRILADSVPIVAGLRLPYSFYNLSDKVFRYDPNEPLDSAAHALCIMGYDDIDSTFECMNSWGSVWGGDQGFVRIHYADMFALLCCAYRITPLFAVERRAAPLSGAVVLRRSIGYDTERNPRFEEIRVTLDSSGHFYRLASPHQNIRGGFQVLLREVPRDWHVYLFNVEKNGAVQMLYQGHITPDAVEKVLPDEETRLEPEGDEEEWLGVLFSRVPLAAFEEDLEAFLKGRADNVPSGTALFFKDVLALRPTCQTRRMGFSFPPKSEGRASLLFFKVEL